MPRLLSAARPLRRLPCPDKQAQALASPTSWAHPFHLLAITLQAVGPRSQGAESTHCPPPLPHRVQQIAPQGTRGWRPRVSCLPYRPHKLPLYTVGRVIILIPPSDGFFPGVHTDGKLKFKKPVLSGEKRGISMS